MTNESYIYEIIDILESHKEISRMRVLLDDFHDYEIAKALQKMSKETKSILYQVLTENQLADTFEELTPENAFEILEETSLSIITRIFKYMEVDDLSDILVLVTDNEDLVTYLSLIEPDKRAVVRNLLKMDYDNVGFRMSVNFIEIKKDFTVKQAIKEVVKIAPYCEYINNIYVTEQDKLIGALSLKELINAGNESSLVVEELMSEKLVFARVTDKSEDAFLLMQKYDFQLLPIVDKYQKLIGIVSFDDMVDILQIESEKDYSSLAGLSEASIDERETLLETIKKRLPWLVILLFVNLFTSSIISSYESALILIPTLSVFMPLVLNMAGNSGTQSLGVAIRMLTKNQLDEKHQVFRHIFNELLTGIVNGLLIGIAVFAMVMVFNLSRGLALTEGFRFAFVIALSINIALIVSTFVGSLIPLVMNLFKLDPAVASGPFITTINDITSLLIYFGLATILIIPNINI